MVVVTWHLGKAAIIDVTTGALAILSLIALIRFKINTSWLILAGGILGLLAARGLG
jgi:chromate transporter